MNEAKKDIAKSDRIYVAGHRGMVGSAIVRNLQGAGYETVIGKSHDELDLRSQEAVYRYFRMEKPEVVVLAAAKVGGIHGNNRYPGDFILENLQMETNVIGAAHEYGVKKLLFLGSTCIYPRLANQPIAEEELLTGPLEPTNEAYAIAKIAGLKMCAFLHRQYGDPFISCMPTNLYGPNDSYDLENSHVLPGMIRKFHEAKTEGRKEVILWGSGSPLREFLHVDDMASACVFLLENYHEEMHVNIGTGEEVSIRELANLVADAVGYTGDLVWDSSMPDGTPRKLCDVSRLHSLGWNHQISLKEGIVSAYEWYRQNWKEARR